MKALNLRQPWADMVAIGKKRIETRMWRTHYRGRLLIVASKIRPDDVPHYRHWPKERLAFGAAVAIVELLDCVPMTIAHEGLAWCPSEPGRWAWILGGIWPLDWALWPIKGQLGLYDVHGPDDNLTPEALKELDPNPQGDLLKGKA